MEQSKIDLLVAAFSGKVLMSRNGAGYVLKDVRVKTECGGDQFLDIESFLDLTVFVSPEELRIQELEKILAEKESEIQKLREENGYVSKDEDKFVFETTQPLDEVESDVKPIRPTQRRGHLSLAEVVEIITSLEAGVDDKTIISVFEISVATLYNIKNGTHTHAFDARREVVAMKKRKEMDKK